MGVPHCGSHVTARVVLDEPADRGVHQPHVTDVGIAAGARLQATGLHDVEVELRGLVEAAFGVSLQSGGQAEHLDAPPAGVCGRKCRRVEGGEHVGPPASEALLAGGDELGAHPRWRVIPPMEELVQRPSLGPRAAGPPGPGTPTSHRPVPEKIPATTASAAGSARVRRLSRNSSLQSVTLTPAPAPYVLRRGSCSGPPGETSSTQASRSVRTWSAESGEPYPVTSAPAIRASWLLALSPRSTAAS